MKQVLDSMSKDNTPLDECPDVIDHVCELLGRRYRKGQIKDELRKIYGSDLSHVVCERVITLAKKQIVNNYKIDAQEYRGYLIEELERLLRNDKTPIRYRIKVIQELASLLGLHNITEGTSPEEYAEKVKAAIKAADASVDGIPRGEDKDGIRESDKTSTETGPQK